MASSDSSTKLCPLRRSDGVAGYGHWLKSENPTLSPPPIKGLEFVYCGSCHCEAIKYQFETAAPLTVETTFYICECSVCFKRGYVFYVTPMKYFRFTSCSAPDLGTYATSAGQYAHTYSLTFREFSALLLSSLRRSPVGGVRRVLGHD
jgi:hypothetical protein